MNQQGFVKILPECDVFMDQALVQAQKAFEIGEVPIGAVIVDSSGKVLAQAYNRVEVGGCQSLHAEALAIKEACRKVGGWRLNNCRIFVTLEPCLMCFGLIRLSRIDELVYAAPSTLFGFSRSISLPDTYPGDFSVISGLKEDLSLAMIRTFFGIARVREGSCMKKIDYAAVREKLLERRRELQSNSANRDDFADGPDEVKDIGDEATLLSSQNLQRTLGEADYSEIKLIDQALERLKTEDYGVCSDCGGVISQARLDYYPYAVRCVVCQEAQDS